MMSGLTIGLLSLDYVSLQVLKNSGEPQERVYAARIIPLVWTSSQEEVLMQRGHPRKCAW